MFRLPPPSTGSLNIPCVTMPPFFNRTENMDGLDIGALLALLFGLWLLFQVGKMLFKLVVLAALAMLVWQYLQHAQI